MTTACANLALVRLAQYRGTSTQIVIPRVARNLLLLGVAKIQIPRAKTARWERQRFY